MDFSITLEQRELIDLARNISENEIAPRALEIDKTGKMDSALLDILKKTGMTALAIPKEYGGAGLDLLTVSMITEELSKGCAGVATICMANALASYPVLIAGTEEQKSSFCNFINNGGIAAFALTEPGAGSDAGAVACHAQKVDGGYILNGTKCFITNGSIAEKIVVFTNTKKTGGIRGLTAFIVDSNSKGVSIGKEEDKMGIRASTTSEIIFEDCFVPESSRLGREGMGFKIAMKTLEKSRPVVGALSVGIAQASLESAVRYAHQRKQFGSKISSFEMVQDMIADMVIKTESARALVQKACWMLDNDMPSKGIFSPMVKAYASDVAMEVSTISVQVMGGNGYSKENPNEKYMRDAKVMQIYEGTNQVQKIVIANGVRY